GGDLLTSFNWLSWTRVTPTSQAFLGFSCSGPASCVAVGAGGMAYVYAAGSWHPATTGVSVALDSIACPSTSGTVGVCFATGASGTVIVSRDGGLHWGPASSGTTSALFGVSCPNSTTCL